MNGIAKAWPVHVPLLNGESFGSWFARLAWEHGLSGAELYAAALPGARLHRIDLDRHACSDLFANLQVGTGVSTEQLEQASFRRWAPGVFGSDDCASHVTWLPALGRSYGRSSFGQQICPSCLAEDRVPYLRAEWRLAFAASCPTHHQLLIDRCPNCAAPFHPLLMPVSGASFLRCSECHRDLGDEAPESTSDHDLEIQRQMTEIADGAWALLGEAGPIHPILYFKIRWQLHRLLATGRYALPLRRIALASYADEPAESVPRLKEVERLNPRCRRTLMKATDYLMADWPHRFVDACKAVGIFSRALLKKPSDLPFAYVDAVASQLSEPAPATRVEDIEAARRRLIADGEKPTYRALRSLLGVKFQRHLELAEPSAARLPRGASRYWKLDGVSPAIKSAARQAARLSGENVGAWVDRTLKRALEPDHRDATEV